MRDEKDLNSRRTALRVGVAAVIAAATALISRRAEAKVQPKAVQYIEESKKPNQNCANCVNFIAPNGCKIVEGEIAPAGWCLVWALAPKKPS